MSYLVDDNGGLNRFPVGAGVYLITHEPSGERYVGQSCHVRTRLAQHLKNRGFSHWVWRRAARDLREEQIIPSQLSDRDVAFYWSGLHPERRSCPVFSFHAYCEAVKRNSDAELLENLCGSSKEQLLAAETRWKNKLKPELNAI